MITRRAMALLLAGASFGKAGPPIVLVAGASRFRITGRYEIIGATGLQHAAALIGQQL